MKDLLYRVARREEDVSTAASILVSEISLVMPKMREWQKEIGSLSRTHLNAIIYIAAKARSNVDVLKMAQGITQETKDSLDILETQVVILEEIAKEAMVRLGNLKQDIDGVVEENSMLEIASLVMGKTMNTTQMLYGEEIRSIQRAADKEGLFLYMRDSKASDIIEAIKKLPEDKIIEVSKGLK